MPPAEWLKQSSNKTLQKDRRFFDNQQYDLVSAHHLRGAGLADRHRINSSANASHV
jgi:hypothetical protein